jgi:putative restriction endonuclease
MTRRNWSREETILAFNLYFQIPFGQIHHSQPQIIDLAKIIDRTPSAVAMKMSNLASYDPELQKRGVKGLKHSSKFEGLIWEEFNKDWEALAYEAKLNLEKLNKTLVKTQLDDEIKPLPMGEAKVRLTKQRVGQNFFRAAVLNAHEWRCCITGVEVKELLIASHIKPWCVCDEKTERTNPRNGLCLNALHDKAFDQGFISIKKDFSIMVSGELKKASIDLITKKWIADFEGRKIFLPHRFIPEPHFIEYHNDVIFRR